MPLERPTSGITGALCSGEIKTEGVFLSVGAGVFGGGVVTTGSVSACKAYSGVGEGYAGGLMFCTVNYYCINEPQSCKKECNLQK